MGVGGFCRHIEDDGTGYICKISTFVRRAICQDPGARGIVHRMHIGTARERMDEKFSEGVKGITLR